ncbi:hypothetical protein FKM82_014815 [Ascaphus truei]
MKLLCAGLVLCASVLAGEGWGFSSDKKVQFASWDEVNVIAHGLLQLGHGLKEHVDKTKSQLKEITGKLSQHNVSLVDFLRQAKQVQEGGELLKGRVQELEDRDRQLYDLSHGLKEKVQEVSRGREQLDQRLQSMEAKIQQLEPVKRENQSGNEDLLSIQSLMETQNQRMDELLEKIKLQQYKLDKQNLQIKSLQSKIQDNRTQSQKWRINLKKNTRDESQSRNSSTESENYRLPSDCHQIFLEGEKSSGVYRIQPLRAQPFEVFCEMTAENHGRFLLKQTEGGHLSRDVRMAQLILISYGNLTRTDLVTLMGSSGSGCKRCTR